MQRVFKFFITDTPLFYTHLWYLYDVIYIYIILYFVNILKFKTKTIICYISIALVILFVLSEFKLLNGSVCGVNIYNCVLLRGLPFFLMGYIIRRQKDAILCYFSKNSMLLFNIIIICSFFLQGRKHSNMSA